ncbi:hypothetical protein C8Q80DRAFT_130620 [Daedaleopsis nitida]|nr:hypothetical protein C8Q80DRAFT_130620 [Daedaleopsis nitida]
MTSLQYRALLCQSGPRCVIMHYDDGLGLRRHLRMSVSICCSRAPRPLSHPLKSSLTLTTFHVRFAEFSKLGRDDFQRLPLASDPPAEIQISIPSRPPHPILMSTRRDYEGPSRTSQVSRPAGLPSPSWRSRICPFGDVCSNSRLAFGNTRLALPCAFGAVTTSDICPSYVLLNAPFYWRAITPHLRETLARTGRSAAYTLATSPSAISNHTR